MASTERPYREPAPIYKDVWDWDIVLVHGDVKIIGNSHEHIDGCAWQAFGAKCRCGDGPLLSSPVVDKNGRPLSDGSPYSILPQTGEGAIYLDAGPGSAIPVMSGKTYRLNGPRGHHDAFAPGSIFLIYGENEKEEVEPEQGIAERFFAWLRGG